MQCEVSPMKIYKLRQVSEILGGSPKPATLRGYCRDGLIEHSVTPGQGCYVLTEEQLQKLRLGRAESQSCSAWMPRITRTSGRPSPPCWRTSQMQTWTNRCF